MRKVFSGHPKRIIAVVACVTAMLIGVTAIAVNANQPKNIVHLKVPIPSACWAENPADIDFLTEDSEVIAKVKYTGKERSFKFKKDFNATTAYTVDVLEIIKGSLPEETIEIVTVGGEVSLKEWQENSEGETKFRDEEYKHMSDKELAASTVESVSEEYGVDLSKGDTGIVFLFQTKDKKYHIQFAGLSFFESRKEGGYASPKMPSCVIEEARVNKMKTEYAASAKIESVDKTADLPSKD